MSDTATPQVIDLRPPVNSLVGDMVEFLLQRAHLDKQDLAPVLGIHPSQVGRAIRGARNWRAAELYTLADFFSRVLQRDIGPGIFFRTVDEVIDTQNWKKMNGPDLRAIDGMAEVTTPKTARLRLVPCDPG